MPSRIVVSGDPASLAAEFAVLAGLEPVGWVPGGLVLAPLAGGRDIDEQRARLAALALPWRPDDGPAPPLPFPAAVGGGVYRRSPGHAPAPPGVPEVVLVDGEGFGLAEHVTTGMCLDMLADLPDGPALDAGCGSGILALAWARLARGPVLAVDLDPHAVTQARESAWASGLDALVSVRRAALGVLAPDEVADRVVLGNAPRVAQDALLSVPGEPAPQAVLISGLQADDMDHVAAAWGTRGLVQVRRESVGRWHATALRAT
ncbi:MAG: 50S ribosomal protein L11 methyltransferase [Actinomycetota bacterium]